MRILLLIIMMAIGPAPWVRAEESANLEHMRAQMQLERSKEEELALLQLDVERLKLEVEKKKALSELGRVAGSDSSAAVASDNPQVNVRYVLITNGRKEAFLDVDGREVCAHEGMALGADTLKVIAAEGIVLQGDDGTERVVSIARQ